MDRNEVILYNFYALQGLLKPWKVKELNPEDDKDKEKEEDTEVVDLIDELVDQETQLKEMLKQAKTVPSDAQVQTKLNELTSIIDQGTKPAKTPLDNRDTFVKNVKVLNDKITEERQIIENLITASQTTAVASAA